jgi:hypothetical protein
VGQALTQSDKHPANLKHAATRVFIRCNGLRRSTVQTTLGQGSASHGGVSWYFSQERLRFWPPAPLLITFFPRVAITSSTGSHIRYVPRALASAMVADGTATPGDGPGRVGSVSLVRIAATHAQRIGEPSNLGLGVRFYRWRRLDASATRIIEHHPRCTYE